MHDFDRGFLSGFLDSDGSITIAKRQAKTPQVQIRFYNDSLELINHARYIIGEKDTNIIVDSRNGTLSYHMYINNGTRLTLLESLRLVMKEERRLIAVDMLKAIETKDFERIKYLADLWQRIIVRK